MILLGLLVVVAGILSPLIPADYAPTLLTCSLLGLGVYIVTSGVMELAS